MNRNSLFAIGALLALSASSQAVQLNFNGMKANQFQTVKIKYNGDYSTVYAGTMDIKVDGQAYDAYCVDLNNWNKTGDKYNVNVKNLSALGANSNYIKNIYSQFSGGVNSGSTGAALQLAIWDALVDGGDGIDKGNFRAYSLNSSVSSLVSTYLAAKNNSSAAESYTYKYFEATTHTSGWDCNRFQNLMTGEAVPEPMTMIGLGGLALAALRKRRKNA